MRCAAPSACAAADLGDFSTNHTSSCSLPLSWTVSSNVHLHVSCSGPFSDPVVTLAALPLISRAVSRLHFAPCCSDYCTSITIAVRHVRTLSPGLNIIDPPRARRRNALWARTGGRPSCFMIEPFGLILRHSPARLLIAIFAARLSTGRTSLSCQ